MQEVSELHKCLIFNSVLTYSDDADDQSGMNQSYDLKTKVSGLQSK